ncbi:hypothetical protein [Streptomyces sp. NRRL S-813]
MTSTARYRDYGVKVSTEVPPAGDTVDFKDVMRSQAAGQGASGTSS